MDPITHSLTGTALARTGPARDIPLAGATMLLAANAPDIDVFVYFTGGEYAALALRRGSTHGPLALLVLPFVVAAVVLALDRWVRRRRDAGAVPARFLPLLALAAVGVATHPALDWLNTYGIRLLMPFAERWFYGDAVFIVDPWLWLLLGAATFVRRPRWRGAALGAAAVYILGMIGSDLAARRVVADAAAAAGIAPVEDLMVAPRPLRPLAGRVVVQTPDAYHTGDFAWLDSPRVRFDGRIERGPVALIRQAAAISEEARAFLVWSRFPFVRTGGGGIWIGDARYADDRRVGSLGGVLVEP